MLPRLWQERELISVLYIGLIAIALFVLDYVTGPVILIPFFYVILVSLVAWFIGPRLAYLLSVILPLLRILAHILWTSPWAVSETMINVLIQMFSLTVVVYLTTLIKNLAVELRALKGDLSVCAFCGKIHNERGEWEEIESYISRQSEIRFTEGLCPECGDEPYGKSVSDRLTRADTVHQ